MQPVALPSRVSDLAPASECGLLEWLRLRVSSLMLEEMSKNDRGDDSAEHLAAIKTQLGAIKPPLGELPWCPLEVLELERWAKPESEHGHIKRLLACTILLRNAAYVADASKVDFLEGSASTLLRLACSAIALDPPRPAPPRRQRARARRRDRPEEAPLLALRFLLWFLEKQAHPEFRPFAAFCVLLLAVHVGLGEPTGEDLLELCRWVQAEEGRRREALGERVRSERWLTGLDGWEDHKGQRELWVYIASQILLVPHPERTAEVQMALAALAERISLGMT